MVRGDFSLNPRTQTIKISLVFFILFTATNSFLTILTFIYEQAGLTAIGPANIAVSYMTFIFSTIYAPSCQWKIKTQMFLATLAYTLNFGMGLLLPLVDTPYKYALTCIGAGIAGLSAGLLWVSQGRYIHLVCQNNSQNAEAAKAQCFGLFSLIYCLSHISAGFITTFGLGLFNIEIYFLTITITGIISAILCTCLITDLQKEPQSQLLSPQTQQLILSTQPQLRVQPRQQEVTSMRQVFRYYPKMSSILFLLVIDGICYGIHISQITHMIPADTPQEKLNLYAGFCNIALGCGASLGGWVSGFIASRIGSKKSGNIGIGLFVLGSLLVLLSLEAQQFWLTLFSVFLWGVFLFYIEGWLYIVCSRQFKGRSESFSVNKQLGSITCFLFQIIVMFTNNDLNLSLTVGVVTMLAIPAAITLHKLPDMENKSITVILGKETLEQ